MNKIQDPVIAQIVKNQQDAKRKAAIAKVADAVNKKNWRA